MKTQKTNCSPYRIKHAILTPVKGIVTKKDDGIVNGHFNKWTLRDRSKDRLHLWGANEASLREKIEQLKGHFSKEYKMLIITDKQFGMIKNFDFMAVATKKQKAEITVIK
jgi:hypothetical protein